MRHMTRLSGVVRLNSCCLVLALVFGCGGGGDKPFTIQGSVSLQGKPLTSGVVHFMGPGDRIATANIKPDGTFVASDMLPGEVKVRIIEDPGAVGAKGPMYGGSGSPTFGADGKPIAPKAAPVERVLIPKKYQDVSTSGLAYTITPETKGLTVKLD